jgi:hypothetical protein
MVRLAEMKKPLLTWLAQGWQTATVDLEVDQILGTR